MCLASFIQQNCLDLQCYQCFSILCFFKLHSSFYFMICHNLLFVLLIDIHPWATLNCHISFLGHIHFIETTLRLKSSSHRITISITYWKLQSYSKNYVQTLILTVKIWRTRNNGVSVITTTSKESEENAHQ